MVSDMIFFILHQKGDGVCADMSDLDILVMP